MTNEAKVKLANETLKGLVEGLKNSINADATTLQIDSDATALSLAESDRIDDCVFVTYQSARSYFYRIEAYWSDDYSKLYLDLIKSDATQYGDGSLYCKTLKGDWANDAEQIKKWLTLCGGACVRKIEWIAKNGRDLNCYTKADEIRECAL